LYDQI